MDVSVIKLDTTSISATDASLFLCTASNGIEWHNLTLDGKAPFSSSGTVFDCILAISSNYLKCSNVSFYRPNRNGLTIIDSNITEITNCTIQDCTGLGISCSGASNSILIQNNFFRNAGNVAIQLQANGTTNLYNITITGNQILSSNSSTHLALGVVGSTVLTERLIVSNNNFYRCAVRIEQCKQVVFTSNIITSSTLTTSPIAFYATKTIENMVFSDNTIYNLTTLPSAVVIEGYSTGGLYQNARNVKISSNDISKGQCLVTDAYNLTFSDNLLNHNDSSVDKGFQFSILTNPSNYGLNDFGDLTVLNNQMNGVGYGVLLETVDATYKFKNVNISANTIQGNYLQFGIQVLPPTTGTSEYWYRLLVANSNLIGVVTNLSVDVYGSYLIEQNPYQEVWIANGNPNGMIDAPQGSYAIDKTIEADNNYSKNTLTGKFGWEKVSEMDKQVLLMDVFDYPSGSIPLVNDTPAINVFTPPAWVIAQDGSGAQIGYYYNGAYLTLSPQQTTATSFYSGPPPNNQKAIGLMKSTTDGEVKTVIYIAGSSNGAYAGLVFRYNDSDNYWQFYLEFDPSTGDPNLKLDWISGGSVTNVYDYIATFGTLVPIGNSKRIVLKVMFKDIYVSVFYNDLLLFNTIDSSPMFGPQHGIVTYLYSNYFYFQSFINLIP